MKTFTGVHKEGVHKSLFAPTQIHRNGNRKIVAIKQQCSEILRHCVVQPEAVLSQMRLIDNIK